MENRTSRAKTAAEAVKNNFAETVRVLREMGTTGMSPANLWQITPLIGIPSYATLAAIRSAFAEEMRRVEGFDIIGSVDEWERVR